jgi:hypothetical protein
MMEQYFGVEMAEMVCYYLALQMSQAKTSIDYLPVREEMSKNESHHVCNPLPENRQSSLSNRGRRLP